MLIKLLVLKGLRVESQHINEQLFLVSKSQLWNGN